MVKITTNGHTITMCFNASQAKKTIQLKDRSKVIRDDNNSIGEDHFTFYHSNGF